MKKLPYICLIALILISFSGCGYNSIQTRDEEVNSSWSEVVNQFKRRADLIPNLVNAVKGFADQEKSVLEGVTNARAKATSINLTPEMLNDEKAMANFSKVQSEVGTSLSKLIAIAENYPVLKSDANFRDLQAQLEGTENRIAVARNSYIDAIKKYNIEIRSFPANLTARLFGYKTKANFKVENENEISVPPVVKF